MKRHTAFPKRFQEYRHIETWKKLLLEFSYCIIALPVVSAMRHQPVCISRTTRRSIPALGHWTVLSGPGSIISADGRDDDQGLCYRGNSRIAGCFKAQSRCKYIAKSKPSLSPVKARNKTVKIQLRARSGRVRESMKWGIRSSERSGEVSIAVE